MNIKYLPAFPPLHWHLGEVDDENSYIEFIGHKGEFLLSIGYHPEENNLEPYEVYFTQTKGSYSRFDFCCPGKCYTPPKAPD